MNYIQTFYSSEQQSLLHHSFGWVNSKFHLMSWALSCMSIKKSLGRVELYTNRENVDFFINTLCLPYDEVHEISPNFKLPHPQLWALPKIYTYSVQKTPFIHIDGDVFIFDDLISTYGNVDLIAQNEEYFTDYYYRLMPSLLNSFNYIPNQVKEDFMKMEDLKALNAGILGGCNTTFFKEYTAEAFRYINLNLDKLSQIDVNNFNVFFEQHLCYKMAKKHGLTFKYVLSPMYCDNGYSNLSEFHKIPLGTCSYIHLLGNYKRDLFTCLKMENTLRCLFPKYHQLIEELFSINEPIPNANTPLYLNTCSIESQVNKIRTALGSYVSKKMSALADFNKWISNVHTALCQFSYVENNVLLNQEIKSFQWYKTLMVQRGVKLVQSPFANVFTSNFDWARLYRSKIPNGVEYYQMSLEDLIDGHYYSLFVKEIEPYSFTIYDIDCLEYKIYEELQIPLNIDELYAKMESYVEQDVIKSNKSTFYRLIRQNITRLVLCKAIMPLITDDA